MATLPKRVQDQLAAADALLAQQNTPQEPAPVAPAPEAPTPQPAPIAEPTPAPAADPTPAPAPTPEVNWEHKFRTLQGLFNAEVPKLQNQVKELGRKVQETEELLSKRVEPPAEPKAPTVDPKDVDAFGEDLVQMVQRVTNSVLGSVAQRMDKIVVDFDKRIGSLEAALKGTAQTVAMTAEEMFFDRIGKAIPDWQEVNQSDAFIAWLAEIDPVYGEPRQAALNIAQQNLNAERAIAVFKAFKATIQPANPAPKKTSSLDKQVSPSNVASAPPSAPAGKPIYKQSDIQSFYADVAKGKYRGRDAEVIEIEQLINEAIAEGRVM